MGVTRGSTVENTEDQVRRLEPLGQLASGFAHDLNNALCIVQSYACMLEESLDAGDVRHEDAVAIRRAGERASAITAQLLALSPRAGGEASAVCVDEVITELVPILTRLLGPRIAITTVLGEVPDVVVDRSQLAQLLMSLAVTAHGAMADGGRLTLETHVVEVDDETAKVRDLPPGRYVTLAVTVTGRGIEADAQARLLATDGACSNLRGIVARARGSISLYSELGHGTTFRIHLPVPAGAVFVMPPVAIAALALPPATVLVVDDDDEVRAVVVRILRDAGCRVLEARSGEQARRICVSHEETLDVALLDVVLGDCRGEELARQLAELRPSLKAVMMSGYPIGALSASGVAPSNFVAKPFTPRELRDALARSLGPSPVNALTEQAPARARVLLVEDEDHQRSTYTRLLRRAEFDVIAVDNGKRAIAELASSKFDAILSDVHMPEGDGLDLLRAVRRVDLDIPVVLMSGAPDVGSAATAVEYGAFRYLMKPLDADTVSKVLRHASRAHALARLRREAFAVAGTHAGAVDRAGLEVRFAHAIERLWIAFQPILHAQTGELFGVEALLRSTEPSMPGPQHVLAAAVQLGLMPQLGRRVRALSGLALEDRTDGVNLFVNLDPEDLSDLDLVAEDAPLTRIASRVILEITERTTLTSSPELSARLARLRALGFRIAIDDIGAGYSGLTSFTELKPEIVKIDMALIRDCDSSVLKQRTVRALCELCHDVGCVVVAEGIETTGERDCVVALGCNLLQGFLFGRPARELP